MTKWLLEDVAGEAGYPPRRSGRLRVSRSVTLSAAATVQRELLSAGTGLMSDVCGILGKKRSLESGHNLSKYTYVVGSFQVEATNGTLAIFRSCRA
jgi:hypothetical protein